MRMNWNFERTVSVSGSRGPMDWDEVFVEMDYGGIEKSALHPLDITTTEGGYIVTK